MLANLLKQWEKRMNQDTLWLVLFVIWCCLYLFTPLSTSRSSGWKCLPLEKPWRRLAPKPTEIWITSLTYCYFAKVKPCTDSWVTLICLVKRRKVVSIDYWYSLATSQVVYPTDDKFSMQFKSGNQLGYSRRLICHLQLTGWIRAWFALGVPLHFHILDHLLFTFGNFIFSSEFNSDSNCFYFHASSVSPHLYAVGYYN